jgi:hypothetical protein
VTIIAHHPLRFLHFPQQETMATAAIPSDDSDTVQEMKESQIPVISFAVALPTSTLRSIDDPTPKGDSISLMGDNGIVGSITLLRNSAMIWVGWGTLDLSGATKESSAAANNFGKGI